MAWVKWSQVLLPYESGGLNVITLKLKNLSLLTKWWWRFLTNENTFWVRVIKSIYGKSGGLSCISTPPDNELKKFSGRVWTSIIKIEQPLTKLGVNLSNDFFKVVGNGMDTSFWNDKWVGELSLKEAYPRLYRLESSKDVSVADRVGFADNSIVFS
ncbi:uncharacterized protein [Rutidosis leptorrhynchoides]|uniref:uncharacterized protein n=1 Tax=Rutidosis leptorrhynchoides TaxID=125765 RepID=UPI003A98D140